MRRFVLNLALALPLVAGCMDWDKFSRNLGAGDGGLDGAPDLAAAALNRWDRLSDLMPPRQAAAVGAMLGRIYVFGGGNGTTILGDSVAYDPKSAAWSTLAPSGSVPTARGSTASGVIDDKWYVLGGSDGASVFSTLHRYDPSMGDGSWSLLSPAGDPRPALQNMSSAVYAGKLYFFGGIGSTGTRVNDLYLYDPLLGGGDGTFRKLNPQGTLPGARESAALAAIGDRIYMFAGFGRRPGTSSDAVLGDMAIYDPGMGADGAWSSTSPAGLPMGLAYAASSTIGGKWYLFGGLGYFNLMLTYQNGFLSFDPTEGPSGTWHVVGAVGSIPTARAGAGATTLDGKFYLVGGNLDLNRTSNPDDAYTYTP